MHVVFSGILQLVYKVVLGFITIFITMDMSGVLRVDITIELMFAGVNMFLARLRLILARAASPF